MSKWTKIRNRCVAALLEWLGVDPSDIGRGAGEASDTVPAAETPAGTSATPAEGTSTTPAALPWDSATLASCWGGTNASRRIMNALSPKMPDEKFREYVAWTKAQGANTIHLILVNKRDGEYAGYSPWGEGKGPSAVSAPNAGTVNLMCNRMRYCRDAGLAVVVWLCTDDSSDWAKSLAAAPTGCLRWIADDGLLAFASTVVLGLEMDEYWTEAEVSSLAKAVRKVYKGKIGVHHTSGKAAFAKYGDLLFYQVAPGRSAAQIAADTAAALRHGKPVNFFEIDRGPNAALAQAALDAGAFGVGNCAPGVQISGAASPTTTPTTNQQDAETAETLGDAAPASSLDWRFGGFDGSKAAEDPATQIKDLKVGASGLSYKWAKGSLKNWGLADTQADAIAAVFYQDGGGKWIGGKFDWISTSRLTRDFKNIDGGYHGWDAAAFKAAKKHAFCIVSQDGKRRTNLVTD